jgi:acyl-coenzyme A thioesterase PaaI-like protein
MPGPPPFFLRYGISRTGDPAAPLVIEPYPDVCRSGALRPTVLAAAVDTIGSLFAREVAGRDGIFTTDLSVRSPVRPVPKRIVVRGALLRAGRSLIASEALLEVEGAPFAYGQTTFQRVPRKAPAESSGASEALGLPEVLAHFPLERPLADEAGVVVADASRGRVELPLGPASLSPQGVMQGALVALVVEEAALALAEHGDAGAHVVTELDIRYLAVGREGPIVSSADWVGAREDGTIRVALRDAGHGNRITTAGLARVARAARTTPPGPEHAPRRTPAR